MWSGKGQFQSDEDAVNFILANSPETKGMKYGLLHERPQRFHETDEEAWTSDIKPGVAYTPFQHQVENKKPWRTLTGRQQFYLDHPWFLEFGEQLPIYREPLAESAKYLYFWNTPHGRWSIHSTWRDARYQLRRGSETGRRKRRLWFPQRVRLAAFQPRRPIIVPAAVGCKRGLDLG